jgi:DNA-binding CsgD family transcriptional regulator/PAS domain-containing protein
MRSSEQFSALVGAIYDAALTPESWPLALEMVSGFIGGEAVMLLWQDVALGEGNCYYSWGDDPAYTTSYFAEYIKLSQLVRMQHLVPVGSVASFSAVVGEAHCQGQFYDEWLRPQGYVDNVFVNLERSNSSHASFAVMRHERQGLVDTDAKRRLELLYPHLQRAITLSKLVDLRKSEASMWSRLLDSAAIAFFLTDSLGRVLQTNERAQAILAQGDLLMTLNGRLAARDHTADRTFRSFLHLAETGDCMVGGTGTAFALPGRGNRDHVAHLLPLRSTPHRKLFDGPSSASVAVFVRPLVLDTKSGLDLAAHRYGLTPRETQVLRGIVEVGGVSPVATLLGISDRTVKAHLQSIFSKTGTARQVELVKLVGAFGRPF